MYHLNHQWDYVLQGLGCLPQCYIVQYNEDISLKIHPPRTRSYKARNTVLAFHSRIPTMTPNKRMSHPYRGRCHGNYLGMLSDHNLHLSFQGGISLNYNLHPCAQHCISTFHPDTSHSLSNHWRNCGPLCKVLLADNHRLPSHSRKCTHLARAVKQMSIAHAHCNYQDIVDPCNLAQSNLADKHILH